MGKGYAAKPYQIHSTTHLQFKGIKEIAGIKKNCKHDFIGTVKNSQGELQSDRQGIADVFADFYSDLYACRGATASADAMETASALCAASPITANELRGQLRKTANGKSADSKGVVMELLKHSGDDFLEIVAQVFTDILDPASDIPEYWKQTRLKVLFKKGDPQLPDNYRPISILPILYKLFSKVLCARIKDVLIAE